MKVRAKTSCLVIYEWSNVQKIVRIQLNYISLVIESSTTEPEHYSRVTLEDEEYFTDIQFIPDEDIAEGDELYGQL